MVLCYSVLIIYIIMLSKKALNIPKQLFIAHKQDFKNLLDTRLFVIASLYWEYDTSINDIANKYGLSGTRIRQLLYVAKKRIKENGYTIE